MMRKLNLYLKKEGIKYDVGKTIVVCTIRNLNSSFISCFGEIKN
jgi:hypothetical protein